MFTWCMHAVIGAKCNPSSLNLKFSLKVTHPLKIAEIARSLCHVAELLVKQCREKAVHTVENGEPGAEMRQSDVITGETRVPARMIGSHIVQLQQLGSHRDVITRLQTWSRT